MTSRFRLAIILCLGLASSGHKTLGNWYTTPLNVHGNPIDHYGDLELEMSRKKLPQTGAIKRFLG